METKTDKLVIRNGFLWIAENNGNFGVDLDKRCAEGLAESSSFNVKFDWPTFMLKVGSTDPKNTNLFNSKLILGANSFVSELIPFSLLQNYDVYTFYNSDNQYHIGLIAISKIEYNLPFIFCHSETNSISESIKTCVFGLVLHLFKSLMVETNEVKKSDKKLKIWILRYIFGLQKTPLSELLSNPIRKSA